MSTLLVRGGTVVNSTGQLKADVFIENETIVSIGPDLGLEADRIIDATGCLVLPGAIDVHTHMELPVAVGESSDTFETGTLAALHGGTTTIIDFANQVMGRPVNQAVGLWHEKATGHAMCDYGFHVSVTDLNDQTRPELEKCIEGGITSFKTFLAYPAMQIDDEQMLGVMREAKKLGALVTVHAEEGATIEAEIAKHRKSGELAPRFHASTHPSQAEGEAIDHVMALASQAGVPVYIVHLSSAVGLQRIEQALKRKHRVFAETCIQYLLLDEKSYATDDALEAAKFIMSPPVRGARDREALWDGLKRGVIKVIATDHCPFRLEQKRAGLADFTKVPNGVPGVEHRLELLYSEGVVKRGLSLERFVDVSSTTPAKIFGLYPEKGAIAEGANADLVVFDPRVKHTLSAATHHMRVDYSCYEGWQVQGKCRTVILRGTVAIDNGASYVSAGFGKFLKRGPSGQWAALTAI